MPDYPECERMAAVANESNSIGHFLDWLNEQGIHLAEWNTKIDCHASSPVLSNKPWRCVDGRCRSEDDNEDLGECGVCDGTGFVERIEPELVYARGSFGSYEQLLARYFNIDLGKVDDERRQMLDALRAANS